MVSSPSPLSGTESQNTTGILLCNLGTPDAPTTAATRRYLADMKVPEGDEVEMPEDDTSEPLPEVIDIGAVAVEALALALPLYPRAPGAALEEAVFAEAGVAPLKDEDLRPFAGLAGLAAKLGNTDKGGNGGAA